MRISFVALGLLTIPIIFPSPATASASIVPRRSQQTPRISSPSEEEQRKVEKVIKDTYKSEYQKGAPPERLALAQKLLKEGVEAKADASTQYVLLREAREIAAKGGDHATALSATAETVKVFDVDDLKLKTETWDLLSRSTIATQSPKLLAESYATLSQTAITMDRYDEAFTLAKKAEAFAKDPKLARFLAAIQQQSARAADLQKAYQAQKVKPAAEILRTRPDDADASAVVGKFYCFDKLDWEKGLPLLARGSDETLKSLAEKELARPTDPVAQMTLADEWWTVSTKESNSGRKKAMQARAVSWYELAEGRLSGPAKEKVQKKVLQYLNAQNAVDLLKLFNPQSIGGEWTFVGGALISPKINKIHALPIPYEPPEEYDLIIITEKKEGWNLLIGLATPGGQVVVITDGGKAWFEMIDGAGTPAGAPNPFPRIFAPDRPSRVVCQIRKFSVVVSVDNITILSWYGDLGHFTMNPYFSIPNPRQPYIGAQGALFHTSKITLIPVTGTGKSLR
jgi:hypothetical protein